MSTTDIRAGIGIGEPGDPMYTLQSGKQHAVAFVQNTRDEVRLMGGDGQIVGALPAQPGAKQQCYVAHSVALRGREGGGTIELGDEVAGTLRASGGGGDKPHVLAFSWKDYGADVTEDLAPTMRAMGFDKSHANAGGQLAVCVVHGTQDPITQDDLALPLGRNSGQENAVCVTGDITHALKAEGFDASEDGTGRGNPIVTVPRIGMIGPWKSYADWFGVCWHPDCRDKDDGGCDCASRGSPDGWFWHPDHGWIENRAIAFQERGRENGRSLEVNGDIAYALTSPNGGGRAQERNIATADMAVRRLMPIEAERLQGFEDNWTLVPVGKGFAADGPRYRQLGNSWAVPVVAWIGRRIAAEMAKTVDLKPQQIDSLTVWILAP